MSAVALNDEATAQREPVLRTGTPRTWDPVAFRMQSAPRSAAERFAELRAWVQKEPVNLPDAQRWSASIAITTFECLLGQRSPRQLSRWLSDDVYRALSRRAGLAVRVCGIQASRRVSVRSCTVQRIDHSAAEATVIVHDGARIRAAAIRLECFHGRWLVTALEIG